MDLALGGTGVIFDQYSLESRGSEQSILIPTIKFDYRPIKVDSGQIPGGGEPAIYREKYPSMPRLIPVAGPAEGAIFMLSRDQIPIGREPSISICIADPLLSRRHCSLVKDGDSVSII